MFCDAGNFTWTFLHLSWYLIYLGTAHTSARCRHHNTMSTGAPTYTSMFIWGSVFTTLPTYHSVFRTLSAPSDSSADRSAGQSLEWLSRGSYWYGSIVALVAQPSATSDPELPLSNGEKSQERLSSLSLFELLYRHHCCHSPSILHSSLSSICPLAVPLLWLVRACEPRNSRPLVTSGITTPIIGRLLFKLDFQSFVLQSVSVITSTEYCT